mmetsp:Transcript_3215/g.3633  ORF Transcript_3215/g.3633 Transcript_3215/m.3633 type:complete len:316 (-) Transcript_3215:1909-2856(-)
MTVGGFFSPLYRAFTASKPVTDAIVVSRRKRGYELSRIVSIRNSGFGFGDTTRFCRSFNSLVDKPKSFKNNSLGVFGKGTGKLSNPKRLQVGNVLTTSLQRSVLGCPNLLPHHGLGLRSARLFSSTSRAHGERIGNAQRTKNLSTAIYFISIVVVGVGVSYAAVPLYKVFCQATGFGGTTRQATIDQAKKMVPVQGARPITVRFAASTTDTLQWKFKPQQREVKVVPGETALAFYTAYNKSDEPIVGVATYNITPLKAGVYFNKIQCFCFDQQRLKPKEEVDMPVFFYIDPEFENDPQMENVRDIVLSYTFFKAK